MNAARLHSVQFAILGLPLFGGEKNYHQLEFQFANTP